jgi:moderate conductance mechanosensitive channel
MRPLEPSGLLAATSPAAADDRGVIHQFLVEAGVSSGLAHTIQVWVAGPFKVVVILAIAFVLTRLQPRLARRIANAFRVASPLHPGSPRGSARAKTIAGVLSAIFRAVIWIIAVLTIFSELGLHLTPFVATATVVGAALGFGAQTLVKDFLSGILILAEDQYGVGDRVVVGANPATATTGTVEGVTLRVTRIRSMDGVVWYVPNGDIRTVANTSEGDTQAFVEIIVPLGTDLVAANQVAEDESNTLATDPAWAPLIVGRPTFAGVAEVSADGATLRVMARTAPGVDGRVSTELRLRILEGLRRRGLAWVPEASGNGATPGGSDGPAGSGPPGNPRPPGGAPVPGDPEGPRAGEDSGRHGGREPADRPPPATPTTTSSTGTDTGAVDGPVQGGEPPTSRSSTQPPRRISLPRWLRRWWIKTGEDPTGWAP